MKDVIVNKSAIEDITKWGFTYAEVEELGIAALYHFNALYGYDIMNFTTCDTKKLYTEVIEKPEKYKNFFSWLKPRFLKFIELEIPLRIYVGGDKQFLNRGDETLEKSLQNVYSIINKYIDTGKIIPTEITMILYYLNMIFK